MNLKRETSLIILFHVFKLGNETTLLSVEFHPLTDEKLDTWSEEAALFLPFSASLATSISSVTTSQTLSVVYDLVEDMSQCGIVLWKDLLFIAGRISYRIQRYLISPPPLIDG